MTKTPTLAIGSDHGGFELKEALKAHFKQTASPELAFMDCGTHDAQSSVDYPDFAQKVTDAIIQNKAKFGVLICTSGIGISIAANKIHGIRAAICHNEDAAEFSRRHNNANIICFGQKYTAAYMAAKLTQLFIQTPFEAGRHSRRVDKITQMET